MLFVYVKCDQHKGNNISATSCFFRVYEETKRSSWIWSLSERAIYLHFILEISQVSSLIFISGFDKWVAGFSSARMILIRVLVRYFQELC